MDYIQAAEPRNDNKTKIKGESMARLSAIGSLILFFSSCIPATPESTCSFDPKETAIAFVKLLSNNSFEKAHEFFNDEMAAVMPPEKLKVVWGNLIDKIGKFKGIVKTKVAEEMGYKAVYVTCNFATGIIFDVKVVLNKEGKIAGLWFFPPSK